MSASEFLELFIEELKQTPSLREYHRIINSDSSLLFRKAYVEQRLKFIEKAVKNIDGPIWDLGCGYATTSIFLSLLGKKVIGTTLEFYYDKVKNRYPYWEKYGKLDQLEIRYENIFDNKVAPNSYQAVIVQDTLHHLEPINDAINIIEKSLQPKGMVIVSEENGNNIIQNIKLLKIRGFKRIIEIEDEKLGKKILLGNENIRSMKKWKSLFANGNFHIHNNDIEYIRCFPPGKFTDQNYNQLIQKEQKIWKRNSVLRELIFFGINFIARKS